MNNELIKKHLGQIVTLYTQHEPGMLGLAWANNVNMEIRT